MRILNETFEYSGNFQIHILGEKEKSKVKSKEKIEFWLDAKLLSSQKRELLLEQFKQVKDFKEILDVDRTLDFEIKFVEPLEFTMSKGSGKIRRVIDHRIF